MQSKPILEYIFFGTALRYLQDVDAGFTVHGEEYVLYNIDSFLYSLQEFDLPVTQRAAYELQAFRDKLSKSASDSKCTVEEANELCKIMEDLRKTLFAEAKGNIAFVVTDKRIDVNKLLSDVPSLMVPHVFGTLPDVAKYDFVQAGKCIAFELPTAAAFHMLRGTEAVLRHFYCSVVQRNRVALLWGPMVESLRRCKKSLPLPLLDNLDNIRRSFRNPTQHPEKIYDIQEVQDVFSLCVDVVNRMAKSKLWRTIKKEEEIP